MDEVEIDDVEFDSNIIKNSLSPTIWKDGKLDSTVRTKLIKAAKVYYEYLKIEPVKLKDITITGSMANYNYHDLSDIDVHLILTRSEVDDNAELVDEFFATKKALWQMKHDIKVKGHDVEFYAQDADEEHHSTGVYSLIKNDWVIKPSPQTSLQVDANQVRKKSADFMNQIEIATDMPDSEAKVEAIDKIKEKIKTLRAAGLNSDAEEFSVENLTFKVLRNTQFLQKLSDAKLQARDKELSLDEYGSLGGDLDPRIAAAATVNNHSMHWRETPVVRAEDTASKDENTLMVQEGIEGMDDEKIGIIKDFISFTRDKLGLEEPVKVGLRKGRDEYIRTTASYLPYENENYVRCEGRALVDILRSIGHELTHNRQRELGIFDPGDNVQNIGGHIEDQANAIAGILIKDFVDNHGYSHIHELY